MTVSQEVQPHSIHAWLLAIRPKTLPLFVCSVLMSSLLAYAEMGSINWIISISAFLFSCFVHIGTNLINDACDFKRGTDSKDRLGPLRMTQSGLLPMKWVYAAGIMSYMTALLMGTPLIFYGGWPVALLLGASVLSGYFYTEGPYPLGYLGLGELFVLLFYGYASILTVYFLQTGTIHLAVILAATQIGLLTVLFLSVANLRDFEGDARSHKWTLAARFGLYFGRCEVTLLTLLPFLLNPLWFCLDRLSMALLPYLALPFAINLIRHIWATYPSIAYNRFIGKCLAVQLLFTFFLILGMFR